MKIKIFNGKEKEIKQNNNIFIGISVGVKPLNEKIAKEYLDWALKNTKEKVIILIADEIAKFNYNVFSKYSKNKSLKRAIRDGQKHAKIFENTINKYFREKKDKINLIFWKDIEDDEFKRIKRILDEEIAENKEFRNKLFYFLNKYVERRKKKLAEKQKEYLTQYLLYELPTLLNGIQYENNEYKLLLYPTYVHSGMSEMVTDITKGKIFPELKNKLNLKSKTILVESYISEQDN